MFHHEFVTKMSWDRSSLSNKILSTAWRHLFHLLTPDDGSLCLPWARNSGFQPPLAWPEYPSTQFSLSECDELGLFHDSSDVQPTKIWSWAFLKRYKKNFDAQHLSRKLYKSSSAVYTHMATRNPTQITDQRIQLLIHRVNIWQAMSHNSWNYEWLDRTPDR